MLVTLPGILRETRLEQSAKAYLSILATPFPMSTVVRLLQLLKAPTPMVPTVPGILTDAS